MFKLLPNLLLLLFVTAACAQTPNPNPTCSDPVGIWHNELGSSLIIESLDASTGQIEGMYMSPSGAGSVSFPLVGWVNDASVGSSDPCKDCKANKVKVISFTVRWGNIGSITAWAGTCSIVDGVPTIKTMWHLARPNSQFDWDHVLTGSDTFTPGAP